MPYRNFLSFYQKSSYIEKDIGIIMKKLFFRESYLKNIRKFIDKPIIKVITGMRRAGKSYFLIQIQKLLKEAGVDGSHMVYINKESIDYDFIVNYKDLYNYVEKQFQGIHGKKYLFIDEIQEIEEWEKTIGSFFQKEEIDIYITGSNANLLSSDLATLLSGRYIEFPIYTLSFEEYLLFNEIERSKAFEAFGNYIKFGGLPGLFHMDNDETMIFQYLSSIYDTIVLKDVIDRHQIRNVGVLKNIIRFIFDNIGNVFSAKKVCDYLKSQNTKIGINTVQNYIEYFVATYVLYKVERMDIKGKRLLEYHEKYYLGDIGLRHALFGYREGDISGILENIVFLELKRRGYTVYIGKLDQKEVDFIAERANEKCYIQVAYRLGLKNTIDREFKVLESISDNYPKYVISMDQLLGEDYQGIRRLNLIDFLLSGFK